MVKLKLGPITDDKPVKVTIELPATVFRDLAVYADILGKATKPEASLEPAKLIVPMLIRFMATDRAFAKARKQNMQPHPHAMSGGS